ncbi:MAG: PaaI family thioesterase [Alphaproteobacteria bacterium]|nr:PaaI family thioesterase [Alphaproteobacteria bacterium]
MSAVVNAHEQAFGVRIPFVEHLGFEMVFFDAGRSEMRFTPKPEHKNSFDVAHGGAIMALLDVSMATAARSVEKAMGVVTIEMKTSFMQPANGMLTAKGHLLHRTRSMAFVETRLFNELGTLCAHATGTFKYVPRRETHQPLSTD